MVRKGARAEEDRGPRYCRARAVPVPDRAQRDRDERGRQLPEGGRGQASVEAAQKVKRVQVRARFVGAGKLKLAATAIAFGAVTVAVAVTIMAVMRRAAEDARIRRAAYLLRLSGRNVAVAPSGLFAL